MANSLASSGASALLASDLIIEITPRWISRFRGTSAQLVAEGLIPKDFEWPYRTQTKKWKVGDYEYSVQRCRIPGVKGPMSIWVDGDFWVLDYEPIKKSCNYRDHLIYTKTTELAEIIHRQTPEWSRQFHRAYEAKKDDKYMAFRNLLTGGPKRGRGQPAKNTTTQQPRGASA